MKHNGVTDAPEIMPEITAEKIDIPFTMHTLSNGLRVIIHEDHKAPIVAVNIWYHVGAKNEKPGKSGLAHLFEHLMFNGSEHFNDDYFQALLAIGATDINGTTSHDRTNYFQNVPTAALDQVLWLESDRMGHLLGTLDQAKLDEQRGVVQNEKRQRENIPYGIEQEIVTKEMFPPGHPYSWTVIGSMEDLDRTTVEDCHAWFREYYGAANAVLVVAGDVTPDDVLPRIQYYFGDIPPGPPIARPGENIPLRRHNTRSTYQDRVPEARISMVWNTPQLGTRDDALLSLAGDILSHGKNARLYKRLVYEQKIATSASAAQWSLEIAGNFVISANIKQGESERAVEDVICSILEEFLREGPTEVELQRARAQYFAAFIKGLERIGGFGGKSDILASHAVMLGDPEAYKVYHDFITEATPEAVREACTKWLSEGKFTLTCIPMPQYQATRHVADRTKMPALGNVIAGKFPEFQRTRLDNGLNIILAQRPDVPTVVTQALIHTGFVRDIALPGLASLAMGMMDEGIPGLTALEINDRLQLLGASLQSGAGLDYSMVRLNTLGQSLSGSIRLFSEILQHPVFPDHELERLRKEQVAAIQREKVTPMSMALRVVPKLLFGKGHRLAQPLTGSGYEGSVAMIGRDQIEQFHNTWIRPNNTTLIVVGDLTLDAVTERIAQHPEDWLPADLPESPEDAAIQRGGGKLYIMDRPGSLQSIVIGAYLIDAFDPTTEIATEIMNDILGGQFTSGST